MDNLRIHLTLIVLGALLLPGRTLLRAQVNHSDVPEVNPARPTVSTPATLTPVGYLQFENGGLYAANSSEFKNRLGFNQVSKLTLDRRVEVLALFEPFTRSTGAEVSGNRPGEVWHFAQPLTHSYAVGNLWSASYPVRRNLVIDAGFDHGFTSSSTHWEGFGGFTYILPQRLWRQRR